MAKVRQMEGETCQLHIESEEPDELENVTGPGTSKEAENGKKPDAGNGYL
jgi:hypothetical protein